MRVNLQAALWICKDTGDGDTASLMCYHPGHRR